MLAEISHDFLVTGRAILEGRAILDRPVILGKPDGLGRPVFIAAFAGSSFLAMLNVSSENPAVPFLMSIVAS